jgi:MFS family permease
VTEPTLRVRGAAFKAFDTPAFTRFYIGTLVSQLGFWSSHISYQDLMSDLTSDELWVSLLFVFAFGPVLFVGPIGGILVDRLDRKRVIQAGYTATMVTAAVQVAIVATDNETPALLLVTSLGVGTTMAIMGPAMQAATANVVPSHQLASAISLQSLGANLSRIVGPALVAPIIAAGLFEVSWGAYFVASGIALMLMSGVDLSSQERDRSKVGFREQLVSGIRHARERQPALAALSLVAVVTIFGVSHISLMPAFTADALDHDKGDFVWLGVATGAGALLGALAAGTLAAGATLRRGAALAVPYCALLLVFSRISSFEIAPRSPRCGEALLEVGDDVVDRLEAHRQPHQARLAQRTPGGAPCSSAVSWLWVVEAGWMTRLRTSPMLATWLCSSRPSTNFLPASRPPLISNAGTEP